MGRGAAKRLCLVFRILMLLLPFGSAFADATREREVVHICGHPVYPPLSWTDAGKVRGVAPTVISTLFEGLGYRVSLEQTGNWQRCLKEVEKGNVDIVVALYKSEARTRYLLYSDESLINLPLVFFYNRDNPARFDSWEDLQGKRVGVLLGDIYGAEADHYLDRYTMLERVSTGEQNFEKLLNQRIDLMPLGEIAGRLQAQKLGYADRIDYLERPLVSGDWYVGISRKSPLTRHMPFVNAEIARLKSSGEIDAMMRHFSEQYLDPASAP